MQLMRRLFDGQYNIYSNISIFKGRLNAEIFIIIKQIRFIIIYVLFMYLDDNSVWTEAAKYLLNPLVFKIKNIITLKNIIFLKV